MAKFIQSSFEELFTNRRYMAIFYLVGTLVLGSIGVAIDSGKATTHSAMWFIVFLVIPLHFVLYACKKFPAWFIERYIAHELALYQSVLTVEKVSLRLEKVSLRLILELLAVSIFMFASIIELLLALLFGGELASSRNESRKAV